MKFLGEAKAAPSILVSHKGHWENIFSNFYRVWSANSSCDETLEIAHLLFRPEAYHFTGISAVSTTETEFPCHILISIFKNKDGGFVYFESKMDSFRCQRVINIGLQICQSTNNSINNTTTLEMELKTYFFTCTHATIYFVN